LPTDAIIPAILASMLGNPDEVHHALIIAQVLGHTLKVRVIGANHNRLCMTKNRIDILDHQFGNVWNMIEDEVPVGTDQAGHMNVFVIDPKVVAFPDKSFDDFDHGDRKSTRLNSSHLGISYAVFC